MNATLSSLFKVTLPLSALLSLAAFGACTNSDIPVGADQQHVACKTDSDCPSGKACGANDYCVTATSPVGCTADSECAAGQVCVANACTTAPPTCSTASDCNGSEACCSGACIDLQNDPQNCGLCGASCPSGMSCTAGACTNAPACMIDSDCPAGQVCKANACTTAPPTCSTATDCSGSEACCSGACIDLQSDPQNCGLCGVSCPSGMSCTAGACTNAPGCTTDAQCASGQHCVANVCTDTTTAACTNQIKDGSETDVDCGGPSCPACWAGKQCAANSDCFNNACVGGLCSNGCSDGVKNGSETDVDCGGTTCMACQTNKACLANSDCVVGISCIGNVCTGSATSSCGLIPQSGCSGVFTCQIILPYQTMNDVQCLPGGSVAANGACNPQARCAAGSECVPSQPDGSGFCRALCSLAGANTCSAGLSCKSVNHPTIGVCN